MNVYESRNKKRLSAGRRAGQFSKNVEVENQQLAWSAVVERMSETTRTPETVAEYRKMTKDQQADIKDVGAFVGGYCNEGSRSNIRHRSILALDADYAQAGLWDDWCLAYGNAAVIYSTHKHTPENPRLRLVVPLSRNVDPDEFQAIGRRVAADLGIDQFDDTTYQPQRCMFWPSTSRDGDYVFDYLDGPALDADAVLGTYYDWRDISAWPMSSRVSESLKSPRLSRRTRSQRTASSARSAGRIASRTPSLSSCLIMRLAISPGDTPTPQAHRPPALRYTTENSAFVPRDRPCLQRAL